jgi:hypothetical protein
MKVTLICLMKQGRHLSRDELEAAERHAGNFVVDDWMEDGIFKRPVQRARLLSTEQGAASDVIPPLFEPAFVRVNDTRMTLRGLEIAVQDGHSQQVVAQEWLLKPVESTS